MNSEIRKVGRPKGPDKVVYKRLVLPERVVELDSLLGRVGEKSFEIARDEQKDQLEKYKKLVEELMKNGTPEVVINPEYVEAGLKPHQDVPIGSVDYEKEALRAEVLRLRTKVKEYEVMLNGA